MNNIGNYFDDGLCISCGICAGNCPVNCIEMKPDGYFVRPVIDTNTCIHCGKCLTVCPNNRLKADETVGENIERYLLGDYHSIYCAKAKDRELLKECASGGVVTTLVQKLLQAGEYQSAFLVEGYDYCNRRLSTKRFVAEDALSSTTKSRYLTVNHSDAVKYLLKNRTERIIFVGTPCAITGLRNTLSQNHLTQEQYLMIGLFCDKTMHYGVVQYFADYPSGGQQMTDYHFRTKQVGGWPGGVRICYANGSKKDLPNTERMKVKDYFLPERCLYCLDKLNRSADIAVGDNYITGNADKEGVSSVIIRTDIGKMVWNHCADYFEIHTDPVDAMIKSASLAQKKQNFFYGCLKGVYQTSGEVPESIQKAYSEQLKKLKVGQRRHVFESVQRDLKKYIKAAKKKPFFSRVKRVFRSICRRVSEKIYRKKHHIKTFLVWGASFSNKGAQAMLFTAISELRSRFPDCRILFNTWKPVPSGYRFETVRYDGNHLALLSKNPFYWYPRYLAVLFLRHRNDLKKYYLARDQFKSIDALIDVSGFALSSQFSYNISDHYLRIIEVAKNYHIPVFLMPQSFGPFDYGEEHLDMVKRIQTSLSYPVKIFAREKQGYQLLSDTLGLGNIEESVDLVLQSKSIHPAYIFNESKPVHTAEIKSKHNVAIIPNVRTIDHGGANHDLLIQLYKELVQELTSSGFCVYLLRHSSEDLVVCQEIYDSIENRQGINLLMDDYDCISFNDIIQKFDFIIGSRYHSIVHAYKNAVPAVVLGWAEKYRELVSLFGQEQYMFDIRGYQADSASAIRKAVFNMGKAYPEEHRRIQNKLPEYQDKNCFDAVSEYFTC